MAWDWLKDNNDEPNEFKPIDARGLLDGKEYHDYWTTKLHNGLANVPKSLLGAVESIPAMAARTRPVVMQELENDLDGTGLMDSDADKEALSDVENQIKGTTAPIWEGARLGIKAAKDALPDANWESNVDESQLSYPKKIGGMILENAPLMAAQLGASIINPALGVALMAGSIAGDAYNDLTEKGVDPLTAGQAGWLDAAAQAPLEGVGEMGWLKAFRELGTEGAAKLMGKAFVKEGLTEAVQEFPDETIPYIAEHGSLDGFDWGQLASNAVDAGVVGGIYGGGFAGIGRAINGKAQPDEAQADNGGTPSPSPAIHAMNRLVNELGIDPKAASGIVGGLMLESGGNTTDISPTAKNPTSGSYGIGQWLGSRQDDLMAFAEETGGDPSDLDTQISFLIHELKGSENGALQEIIKAQSPDEAGRLADKFYERSEGTDEIRNQKAANAQKIYDMFMNGGADPNVVYNEGKRGGSSVPNPKSAEDFLKDLEETLPADTDEDVEKLNAVRKAIQGKNKKAQEELAAQYGWSANSPETAQNASEPVTQGNTQSAADNAATGQMTQSVTYPMAIPQGRGNSISGTKPIKSGGGMYQPSGRVEGGNKSVYTPKKPKGMQYTPQGNVQAGSNEGGMTAVRPNVSPVIPAPSSIKEPASNASTSLPSTEPQIYTPRKVNGIADRQRRDRQTRGNMASAATQGRINKALKNSRLRQVVKQAFVDGDKDALNRLGAMQINQDVLQAVKNDVLNEYHKTEPVVPPKVIPAQEPYTPRYGSRDEAMRLPYERNNENTRGDIAIGGGDGVISSQRASTPREAVRLDNKARKNRETDENRAYDIGEAPSPKEQKKAAIARARQEKRDAKNTNFNKYEPAPYATRYANRDKVMQGFRNINENMSGNEARKDRVAGITSSGNNGDASNQNRAGSRDMSAYKNPNRLSVSMPSRDRQGIGEDMRNRQQNRNAYEPDTKSRLEKPTIFAKENTNENYKENQQVHRSEENKNDNAKPEQSKPSESKDRKTPEGKNPVKKAPPKETPSSGKKEEPHNEKGSAQQPTLANGYTTESGRLLSESDARDFIVKPDGSKEFGHFGKEIEDATGGKVLAKGIRLQVGFSRVANGKETGFGIIHIKKRESQLKKLGYNNAEEYILDIINNFSIIYDLGGGRIKLASVGSKFNVMPLDLELKGDGNGYYTVVTAIPKNTKRMQKEAGKKIFDRSASPSSTTGNGAVQDGGNRKNAGSIPQSATEKSNLPASTNNIDETLKNVNNKPDLDLTTGKSIEASKGEEPSTPKETVFGSVEDADKDLEKAFGLKPVANTEQTVKKAAQEATGAKPSKDEIHKKHRLVDDSDEAIQGYIEEFISKTRNLNAGFDPTILVPVFKICAAYTQRGITKFADFASKTIAAFKVKGVKQKDIEPWLAPAWEAVKSFPDTGKKFDAKKLVVALKAVGARYESGLKTADAVKDDIRSKYGDKAVSTLNDYIDASFRGVQAYFNKGKVAEPAKKSEPSNTADRSGTDLIDYAFNQGGIIRKDVIQNMSPEDVDTVSKIFDGGDKSVDSPQENDTIEEGNSNVVSTKEDKDVRGRKSGSGRPVEVGGSGKSSTGGKGEQRTTRGNSETPDRDGGRERGPDAESTEPKNEGTGGSRELGRGQAEDEDGTRMERANGEGTSAGGTKKPVISPKADKVETDIAKGEVKDARDVPGNDYIAKPVPPDAKGASKTQRVDNNIAAIKLLKKIESENRMATPAEQEILAGYSGWGGLGSEMKSDAKRMAQLKELLTEEEYNAAERELLTAFYTPPFVIGRMWELAEHLGFKGGRVLDPSCGVGSARIAAIKSSGRKDPPMINSKSKESKAHFAKAGEYLQVADSPLLVANDLKKASLAPFTVDDSLTGIEGYGKIWACADKIYEEWNDSSDRHGAQLVFCDQSIPDRSSNDPNAYDALKSRLIELGIPESDIAFVQDAKTDKAQAALFEAVNEGRVRVLIGSTQKMGAGTNMQQKLVALHHLDCPWRPRDIEQREGRILRQGNENKEVRIYNYVTKGTYDENLWDTVNTKKNVINQLMIGDKSTRNADTSDVDGDNFEALIELANADPDTKRYRQVMSQLTELESAKTTFEKSQELSKRVLVTAPELIDKFKTAIESVKDDMAILEKTSSAKFSMKIGQAVYENKIEANKAFSKEKEHVAKEFAKIAHKYGVDNAKFKDVKIASARGLDIYVSGNNPSFKAGFASEALTVYAKGKDSYGAATPTAIGVWNAMQTQPAAKLKGYETELKKNESELAEAKESQGDTFKDDEKIKSLREEQEELRKKIEEKAKRQRELDSIEPTPITLYESTSFGSYDLDADDPDIYEIENNIRDGLVLSMRENNTGTGTVSFDKPGSWDKFKKKFIDKTNWAVYSNENTIEITASKKDLNDLYEAIESQEETKYSLSQGGKRISPEEMTKQTLSVFPNAQNIEAHDNGVSFDLPNGSHVEVNFTDDTISVDRAKAQKDYGGTLQGNEKASGKIEMVDKDALITLTMDSPDETISHEAMHLAWNLLTDRERNALLRTYGSEEGAAEGMREWKIRRKMKQGTIAGKIMQKISDMAHKLLSLFHENDQHVFQKLESGEMWERSNENNTAARNVKYKMNPLNEAEKYLKSHKDFGEKAGAYIDRTFRPDLAKAKANPNISVNETAKKKGWGVANTALNNTVRSPSRIKSPKTNYIWGLADTAQRELQELRGRWTHNFAGAIKNLNKEEKARYTDILWEEDMKQHVFSDEELRDAGVSENVIKAHQKTRNLLGKIYNAVNAVYTSERVENFTYKTRKEAGKAQKELAKRPHTFVMHDIRETTKDGETVFQVSIKTRGYKEIHSVMTSEELSALSKDKDVYIKARKQMDDGSFKVSYLAYNKPLTNMEGYMPHIFHGVLIMKKYTDADGNVKSKVVGSADTIEKAVVKADAMQKEEGGEFIIVPKEFSSEGEVENPLLLGDMDYFKLMENLSKGASLTLDEAREMTHATMKGRHVYYGAKKHRKGAEGFEKNAIWAIQHHIDSSSRYVALDPFKQKAISFFERAFGDYNKDWTGEAAFCKGYIDSVLGKPSRLETLANDFLRLFPWFKNEARPARRMAGNLTGLTGVLKLGASLSSGFVNTLQLFNCVGYVGARKTAVGLKRALHPNAADKKILVASGVSEESGLALDSIGHITAEGTALSKVGNVINSVNNFLMKPFTLAEKTIRKATILAAYYKAIGDGLSKGEAIQYARDINRKVNFDYSVADAPRIFRALQGTVIGDMALQFQKYGVKEMEVISDFLPVLGNTTTKQKLEFFIPYLLVSGIWNAFPFEDALLSLLKLLGFGDPEKEAKRAMMEWAGKNPDRKALVNVANYGAGAIVGVDISQRVGLKGVAPETSNIVTGGPLGSTTVQLAKAVLNGDANGAMKAISPAAGNIYGAVAGYNTDSKGRKTVDYDTRDRIVRGLGFRTIKEANATDAQSIVYNYKEQKKNDRAKAKSEYLKDPSSSNRQKLKEMGYSDKEIKALKDDKKSTRVERSQVGLSKDDKKKLKPVFDYVQ